MSTTATALVQSIEELLLNAVTRLNAEITAETNPDRLLHLLKLAFRAKVPRTDSTPSRPGPPRDSQPAGAFASLLSLIAPTAAPSDPAAATKPPQSAAPVDESPAPEPPHPADTEKPPAAPAIRAASTATPAAPTAITAAPAATTPAPTTPTPTPAATIQAAPAAARTGRKARPDPTPPTPMSTEEYARLEQKLGPFEATLRQIARANSAAAHLARAANSS